MCVVTRVPCDGTCVVCGRGLATRAHVVSREEMARRGVQDHERNNIIPLCQEHHYDFYDKGNLIVITASGWTITGRIEDGKLIVTCCSKSLLVDNVHLAWKNSRAIRQLRTRQRRVEEAFQSFLASI